jgi:hypothetical protein
VTKGWLYVAKWWRIPWMDLPWTTEGQFLVFQSEQHRNLSPEPRYWPSVDWVVFLTEPEVSGLTLNLFWLDSLGRFELCFHIPKSCWLGFHIQEFLDPVFELALVPCTH